MFLYKFIFLNSSLHACFIFWECAWLWNVLSMCGKYLKRLFLHCMQYAYTIYVVHTYIHTFFPFLHQLDIIYSQLVMKNSIIFWKPLDFAQNVSKQQTDISVCMESNINITSHFFGDEFYFLADEGNFSSQLDIYRTAF